MKSTLIPMGTIAPDDLNLFKIVDDVDMIPAGVRKYHDESSDSTGFKMPTDEDRRRSGGG